MRRVINWEDYKDNWADFSEAIAGIFFDTLIGIVLLATIIPVTALLVLLGFAPPINSKDKL